MEVKSFCLSRFTTPLCRLFLSLVIKRQHKKVAINNRGKKRKKNVEHSQF